jgi:hypothetical protein
LMVLQHRQLGRADTGDVVHVVDYGAAASLHA